MCINGTKKLNCGNMRVIIAEKECNVKSKTLVWSIEHCAHYPTLIDTHHVLCCHINGTSFES